MRLQARLVAATAAVLVPLVLGLTWLDARAKHRAATEMLSALVQRSLQSPTARARCEAEPASYGRFGPPRPPPGQDAGPAPHLPPPFPPARMYVYDEAMHAADPQAPPFPARLARRLGSDGVAAKHGVWPGSDVHVLVRTPWGTGACAYVLGVGTTGPGFRAAILPASRWWLLPALAVIVVVLLAVWPLVRRLHRLTRAVERSAADGFAQPIPVEGKDIAGKDEVAHLARAFAAAGAEVQAQLAAKDQRERALRDFLSNTTHDVMIPLTVLQAHLATLRDLDRAGQPIDHDALTSAMDEAHYIASLLHNLGAAAKLDAGAPALHRTKVPLDRLIERICARHRPIARQLEVTLDVALPEPPLACDGDVTLLEQLVSNVVYNAIRHNRKGGHVAIILEPLAGELFRLRVLDDGPGVPDAELARVSQRGYRGDAARGRATAGQGLGLHIAHRVATAHDMQLTLGPSEFGGLQVDLVGPQSLDLR
ncbi:MAG TPA: HAMP domain-containing sensor histidine kinase [Kofleriaceae bacterium]|nr:HAMP domain-containing sensor histidine kinase [Kofleriaceae bacterium]